MARYQMEMLMYHADAVGDRRGGIMDFHRLPVDFDGSRVRAVGPEQDVH
jgi:hypothetical protein